MKFLLVFLFPSLCFANEFRFTYRMVDGGTVEILQFKSEGDTWEKAFIEGSHACHDFFVNRKPLNENRILDIVDVCANPKQD